MPLPAIVFGTAFVLLLVGITLVVGNAARRSRRGGSAIEVNGWQRLPDGSRVVEGWQGWPFVRALEIGEAGDIVVGHHQGIRFMSLRLTQRERRPSEESRQDLERYNIVAVEVEHDYPHLSVVRGRRMHGDALVEVDTGDRRFDGRWQVVGDPGFAADVLTDQVRAVIDRLDHAWAFQPGWVTRVVPWEFWAGEDRMLAELEDLAAPWRDVPAEVWQRWGGVPRFVAALGSSSAASQR